MTRRLTVLTTVVALCLAACGGSDDSAESPGTTAPAATAAPTPTAAATVATTAPEPEPADTSAPSTDAPAGGELDPDAPDFGRVVALAEEFILADVLALGVTPIASTATVDTAGFQGIEGFDLTGIEVLPQTTLSLEYLASLDPDTIVTLQFWVDRVGEDVLRGIADLVIIPDGLYGAERITALGEMLGRPEHAAAVASDLATAEQNARDRVGDGCTVSLATIYNSLHQFRQAGLLREVAVDAARSYFDTDTSDHHHFYLEDEQRVIDIPASAISIQNLPAPPRGMTVTHVDVVVRVRKAEGSR